MWKVFIPLLSVIGLCTAVLLNPREFWIDAKPDFVGAGCGAGLFTLIFLLWIVMVYSEKKTEADLALTAYINNHLTDVERKELTEPDPHYGRNSGYLRWRVGARRSPLAYLIPARPPRYADL